MRKLTCFVLVLFLVCFVSVDSQAARNPVAKARARATALGKVCPRVRGLQRAEVWKSKASNHITDKRRYSTSFIFLRGTPRPRASCLPVYDSSGNLIHKLGEYFPAGRYAARYYGGHSCGDGKSAGSVAATAQKNTRSSRVFVKVSTTLCIQIENPSLCYNSTGC